VVKNMAGDVESDTGFRFEDCLLKHHVRTSGWLPACKKRLQALRKGVKPQKVRRLRYFTFCAIGAIDVLMLELGKVLKKHPDTERFDTVYFFEKDREHVDETTKRIPGAIGFPGDFVEVVLLDDPGGDDVLAALDAPKEKDETEETRRDQILLATRKQFFRSFPFDVINLDLERFFFKPSDPFPGRLVNAMRRLFQWQRNIYVAKDEKQHRVDAFALMFTTRVGPGNLGEDYLGMLRDCLKANVEGSPGLVELLSARTGFAEVGPLQQKNFDAFFKLSVPKLIAKILGEEDWYIDETSGIQVFEFVREAANGPYTMLHLVMDVRRKAPPKEQRAPGQDAPQAVAAYRDVVRAIFERPEIVVSDSTIDKATLQEDLNRIKQHRKKYYPEE
jgi:hypothetical protein